MWWRWRHRPDRNGFPRGFKVQRIGIPSATAIADRPPLDVARYLRDNPETAKLLLMESYDKRYSPSSFIKEEGNRFTVGWLSRPPSYECVRHFTNLTDAATDYLLFSLGKGRWTPQPESEESK
jgi:hypothetical protein